MIISLRTRQKYRFPLSRTSVRENNFGITITLSSAMRRRNPPARPEDPGEKLIKNFTFII